MPKLTVNGVEVEVPAGATVLQACEAAGVEIPRFCYHERLSIAGNCRMCLVEIAPGPPKPQASCAMPAADNQVVTTNSAKVKKAREGVMEFLLINHPLDCPICDQGGECDLQDQSVAYGRGRSRFDENKRAVTEKYMGPLIKTAMTRCIHCTRCIRFAEEVAGVEEIGAVYRGENMQITSYLEQAVTSEMSANVIDLCPVGALTSKPYAFEARPWELKKTQSIDVMDAVGSSIRIDTRGNEVMRILPRLNEDVNEEWLDDRARYACDGLTRKRLDRPWVRVDGRLRQASWPEAFAAIRQGLAGLAGDQIAALAGDLSDLEAMVALKDLLARLGSTRVECRTDGSMLPAGSLAANRFNSGIAGIETADVVLFVGCDPRKEAPIVAARIRKAARRRGVKVGVIGPAVDLTYRHTHLGDDARLLSAIVDGVQPFSDVLRNAQRPAIILGSGLVARADAPALLAAAHSLASTTKMVADGWNGFNILQRAASRVGGLEIGFASDGGMASLLEDAAAGRLKAAFLHGVDEIDTAPFANVFTVYVGTHGDRGATHANVILPAAAYTEKTATYVNMEGRVQRTLRAVMPPGDAREDWTILRALSDALDMRLPYDSLVQLQARIADEWPQLAAIDSVISAQWTPFGQGGAIDSAPIVLPVESFYLTNPIARASPTMAACVAEIIHRQPEDSGKAAGTYAYG